MTTTSLDIQGTDFLINSCLTYSEISGSNSAAHGLLMNARLIQGVFDDRAQPGRFSRFGYDERDPEAKTDRLIAALPQWHAHGLQGGGPIFTIDDCRTIDNNP